MEYAWTVIGTVERAGLETKQTEFVVLTSMESREAAEAAALRELVVMGIPRPHEKAKDETVHVTIDELKMVGPVPASRPSSPRSDPPAG